MAQQQCRTSFHAAGKRNGNFGILFKEFVRFHILPRYDKSGSALHTEPLNHVTYFFLNSVAFTTPFGSFTSKMTSQMIRPRATTDKPR